MQQLNNEQIGISAEVAIAEYFNISIDQSYCKRGSYDVIRSIKKIVGDIFSSNNIPVPVSHIATRQNPIDFMLNSGKTLSVKTNQRSLGKVAPQRIGQASSVTWFSSIAPRLNIKLSTVPQSYYEKIRLFKQIALSRSDELLSIYWENMFDCDFLVHIFNIVDKSGNLTNNPEYLVSFKTASPIWEKTKISFTRKSVESWNESNTIKYDGVTIGEYQIHNNRDNFKFRFHMKGISFLVKNNKLIFS